MPDLDRTTLLKAIEAIKGELLEDPQPGDGDHAYQSAVNDCKRAVEALLAIAPSEAPAEAFTAQRPVDRLEWAARLLRLYAGNWTVDPVEAHACAERLEQESARLVRERHTGKQI